MDATEFTTLDEIGEDEASKVKINVIETRPRFNCAAEEIDYLNKVLQGLENNNTNTSVNSICDTIKSSDSHIEHLTIKTVTNDSKADSYDNIVSANVEKEQVDICELSTNNAPLDPINYNSKIKEQVADLDNININAVSTVPVTVNHLSENSDLPLDFPNSSNLLNASVDLCSQLQVSIESVEVCNTETNPIFESNSVTTDSQKFVPDNDLSTSQQEFKHIVTFPISLSEIKTEPLDTGETTIEDYFADPAVECNLADFGAIKEEFMASTPESQLMSSNFQDNAGTEPLFGTGPIKIEAISLQFSEFQLPKVHFKIQKNIFYSKEELDAAMLMTTSSFARILHMDMFVEHRKSFPKLHLFKLEEAENVAATLQDNELDILIPFINIYGSRVHKWKKIFKIKRNYARKRSKHKKKKSHKTKEMVKPEEKYSAYYNRLKATPSPASDLDFEGFIQKLDPVKSHNDVLFDNSSDSDDNIDIAPCILMIESPIKGPKADLLPLKLTYNDPVKERSTDKFLKDCLIDKKKPSVTNLVENIHNLAPCYVKLVSMRGEILLYEKALHVKECSIINCNGFCGASHKLRYPADLFSPMSKVNNERIKSGSNWDNFKAKNDQKQTLEVLKSSQMESKSPAKYGLEKASLLINKKKLKSDNSKDHILRKPKKESSLEIKDDVKVKHEKCDGIKLESSASLYPEDNHYSKMMCDKVKPIKTEVNANCNRKSKVKENNNLKIRNDRKPKKIEHHSMSDTKADTIFKIDECRLMPEPSHENPMKSSTVYKSCPASKKKFFADNSKDLVPVKNTLVEGIADMGITKKINPSQNIDIDLCRQSKEITINDIKSRSKMVCKVIPKAENNINSNIDLTMVESNVKIIDKLETEMVVKQDLKLPIPSLTVSKDVKDTSSNLVISSVTDPSNRVATVVKKVSNDDKGSVAVHASQCKSCTVCLRNILYNRKYRKLVRRQLSAVTNTSLSRHTAEVKKMTPHHHESSNHLSKDAAPTQKQKEHRRKRIEVSKQHYKSTPSRTESIAKLTHKHADRADGGDSKLMQSKHTKEAQNLTAMAENTTKSNFRIPKKHRSVPNVPCPSSLIEKRSNSKYSYVPTYRNEKKRYEPDSQIRSFNIGEKFKSQSASSYKAQPVMHTSIPEGNFHKSYAKPTVKQGNSVHNAAAYGINNTPKSNLMPSDLQDAPPCYVPPKVVSKELHFPEVAPIITPNIVPLQAVSIAKLVDNTDAKTSSSEKLLDMKAWLDDASKYPSAVGLMPGSIVEACHSSKYSEAPDTTDCMSIGGHSSASEGNASVERATSTPKPITPKVMSAKDKIRALVFQMGKKEKYKMYRKYKCRYYEATTAYAQIPGSYSTNPLKCNAYKDMKRKKKLYYDLKIYLLEENKSTVDSHTVGKRQRQPAALPMPTPAPKPLSDNNNDEPYSPSHSPVLKNYKPKATSQRKQSPDKEVQQYPCPEEEAPYSPSGPVCDVEPYSPSAPITFNEGEHKALNTSDNIIRSNSDVDNVDQIAVSSNEQSEVIAKADSEVGVIDKPEVCTKGRTRKYTEIDTKGASKDSVGENIKKAIENKPVSSINKSGVLSSEELIIEKICASIVMESNSKINVATFDDCISMEDVTISKISKQDTAISELSTSKASNTELPDIPFNSKTNLATFDDCTSIEDMAVSKISKEDMAVSKISKEDMAISKISKEVIAISEISTSDKSDTQLHDIPYSPSAPYFSPNSEGKSPRNEDESETFILPTEQERPCSVISAHSDSDRYSLSSMSMDSDCDSELDQSCIAKGGSFLESLNISQLLDPPPPPPFAADIPLPGEALVEDKPTVEIPLLGCFLLPPPPLPTLTLSALDKDVQFMKQFGISKGDFAPSYEAKTTPVLEAKKPISSLFNDFCDEVTKKDVSNMNAFSQTPLQLSQSQSSEEALSKFEKEIELLLEETSFYDKQPLVQPLIDKSSGFPLVGLQYVLEVQKGVKTVDHCSYICSLCSKKMSSDTMIAHVKSVPHRLKFASFHAMDLHSTYGSLELKQWTAALVKEFTAALQKLEAVCGRQQMAVCTEKAVPSAVTYLKNKATEALAVMKAENRKSVNSPEQQVDISSVVASIMSIPKKSVKDIDQLLPKKFGGKDSKKPTTTLDISRSPGPKRTKTPDRPLGGRQRSPVSKGKPRSPGNRRRSRSPPPNRTPWMDKKVSRSSVQSRSPVPIRSRSGGGPLRTRRSRSPFSRKQSRSPFSRKQSRSPFSRKQSRSPFSKRLSRSPFSRRKSRSPPLRRRSRSPRDSFPVRKGSPLGHKRGRSPFSKMCNSPRWSRSPVRQISPRRPKRSRSPIGSGRNEYGRMKKSRIARSPDRRSDSCKLSLEDMKKVRDFKADENELKLDRFAALEAYLGEPESHPKYKVEWNIFWQRRTEDLRRKGMSPKSYDFTGEWTEFWRKKLADLCEDEYNEKQTKLLIRYNFDKKTLDMLHNDIEMDNLVIKCTELDYNRPRSSKRSPSPWEVSRPDSTNESPVFETEFTVYGTLKLLSELEGQLGSLVDSVGLLFNQTKDLLNQSKNPVAIFDDKDNRVLLKLSIGKLSSLVASGVLDAMSQAKTHMAIEHCNWLQKEVEKTFPDIPSFVAGLNTATIAQSTLGRSQVEIASYIAKQLIQIGNTDATEFDLNSVLNAVTSHHGKINTDNALTEPIFTPKYFDPASRTSPGNGFNARPALFPSGSSESKPHFVPSPVVASPRKTLPPEAPQSRPEPDDKPDDEEPSGALSLLMTSYEDNVRTIDDFSLEELLERLTNFSSLNSHDQQELTDHLKKLEATDSKKVTKLRTMMRQSTLKKTALKKAQLAVGSTASPTPSKAKEPVAKVASTEIGPDKQFVTGSASNSGPDPVGRQSTTEPYSRPVGSSYSAPGAPPPNSSTRDGPPHHSSTRGAPPHHSTRIVNENAPASKQDNVRYGEFRPNEGRYQADESHRQDDGFDATNNGRDFSMVSDRAPFQRQGNHPPSRLMPEPEVPPQGSGYRTYSPEPRSDHGYPGMQPGSNRSRGLGRLSVPRGMIRTNGPPRMARLDNYPGMGRSDDHPGMSRLEDRPRMGQSDDRPGMHISEDRQGMARPDEHSGMSNLSEYPEMSRPDTRPAGMNRPESHRGRGMPTDSFRGMSRPEGFRGGMIRAEGHRGMSRPDGYRGMNRPTRPWSMQSSPSDSYSARPRAPYSSGYGEPQRFPSRGRFDGPRRPYDRFNRPWNMGQ